jgi:acylphosphatase
MAKPRKKQKNKKRLRPKVKKFKTPQSQFLNNTKLYQVNEKWPCVNELRNFVLKLSPPSFPRIEKDLRRLGKIKLAIITGVLLNLKDTRVDLMVVGDDIDFKRFTDFIKKLEGDMGTELRYVVLGVNEFKYRRDMFDRFVLDILEYPNKKVINKKIESRN